MKFSRLLFILTFIFSFQFEMTSQSGEDVFNTELLHEVRITFEDDNFFQTLLNNYDQFYPDVPYLMGDVLYDGELVDSVGVRFKGFSSYWGSDVKKSIKLDFNEFVSGKKLDGLKKLNLNNGEGDPSVNRDFICFNTMRQNGVRAPRVAHARVYLNDIYWGLYTVVEQIDDTFLKNNFQDGSGNLFKNIGWTELTYNGPNEFDYVDEIELKTNETENDWSGFINFVDVLNNSSNGQFKDAIAEVLNVNLFLRALAIDVVTDNWDSYMEHGRNFYIYQDPTNNKMQWIPWDYNLAMGGTFAFSFGECDFFPDFNAFIGEALQVSFEDNTWPAPAEEVLWDFGDGMTSSEASPLHTYSSLGFYTVCLTVNPNSVCPMTACKEVDVSSLPGDCNSILNGSSPYPGSDPIFQQVIAFAPTCCTDSWTVDCQDIYNFFENDNQGGGGFPINMEESSKVLINRLMAVPEYRDEYYANFCRILEDNFTEERLFPLIDYNGDLVRDAVYEDENYLWSTEAFEEDLDQGSAFVPGMKQFISNRIPNLFEQMADLYDCSELYQIQYQDIVINEFVASNDEGGEVDQDGETDDWIELYNNTPYQFDLSDFYLADTNKVELAWKFPPETYIEPNGYLIVWADKDENQSGLHADFKLSAGGEQVHLFFGNTEIDGVTYGEQQSLLSYSRVPNGTGDFQIKESTFRANNQPTSTKDFEVNTISVFPNPSDNQINLNGNWDQNINVLKVFDNVGRLVFKERNIPQNHSIHVNDWNEGFKFILIESKGEFYSGKVEVIHGK